MPNRARCGAWLRGARVCAVHSDTAHLCQSGTFTRVVATRGNPYTRRMAHQRNRVNLTLPDEVVRILDRLGKVTGAGRATIIREWLIEGAPMFDQMATAAEQAVNRNYDALKVMADVLRDTSQAADQLQLDMRRQRRAAMRKLPK